MAEKERATNGACGSASVDESKKIWVCGANVGIGNMERDRRGGQEPLAQG